MVTVREGCILTRCGISEHQETKGQEAEDGRLFSGSIFFLLTENISVSERILQLNSYIKVCKPLKQVSGGK